MKKTILIFNVLLLLILLPNCSKDDDLQSEVVATLSKEQLVGAWKITYFENQVDKTSDYEDNLLWFNDGVEFYLFDTESGGIYNLFEDQIANQTYTIINMELNPKEKPDLHEDKFRDLIEQWIVKKVSENATKIELEERISTNTPEKLHLEKVELIN